MEMLKEAFFTEEMIVFLNQPFQRLNHPNFFGFMQRNVSYMFVSRDNVLNGAIINSDGYTIDELPLYIAINKKYTLDDINALLTSPEDEAPLVLSQAFRDDCLLDYLVASEMGLYEIYEIDEGEYAYDDDDEDDDDEDDDGELAAYHWQIDRITSGNIETFAYCHTSPYPDDWYCVGVDLQNTMIPCSNLYELLKNKTPKLVNSESKEDGVVFHDVLIEVDGEMKRFDLTMPATLENIKYECIFAEEV